MYIMSQFFFLKPARQAHTHVVSPRYCTTQLSFRPKSAMLLLLLLPTLFGATTRSACCHAPRWSGSGVEKSVACCDDDDSFTTVSHTADTTAPKDAVSFFSCGSSLRAKTNGLVSNAAGATSLQYLMMVSYEV